MFLNTSNICGSPYPKRFATCLILITYESIVSVFSSNVNDLHAWHNYSWVLPNFEYLCLNKFCNCAHVVFSKGSNEWCHNLASPNSVRQNLCTLMSSSNWWASIQSFEHSRCASASSSGFPENSGLTFDQLRCMCLCLTASWGWGYSCPCLQLGMAAPSSLFAISLPYMLCLSIPNMIKLFTQFHKFQHVPNVWIW